MRMIPKTNSKSKITSKTRVYQKYSRRSLRKTGRATIRKMKPLNVLKNA